MNGNLKVLRRKGKSHGNKETRGKYSKGKSIRKRDKSVYSRKEAGHWEADTVVSGQGKSKACFATLAERKTRFSLRLKFLTEGQRPWRTRSSLCFPPSLHSWSRRSLVTGARNLPTGAELRNGCTAMSILPTPIVPGRKAQTRISMACSGSSIQKAGIYPGSLLPR